MKDTIIKGTGNSRYLRSVADFFTRWPTYQAFGQALVDGTFLVDVLGLNAAGVQQQGDPLNRATLLKDNTAALFGLPNTAVPDDVLKAIPAFMNTGWKLIKEWKTAGTYTWTVPDLFGGKSYTIGVLVIGAGGSGSASAYTNVSADTFCRAGGRGKVISFLETVTPGHTKNLVVGKGGPSVSTSSSINHTDGKAGGSSSFDGKTVDGGWISYGSTSASLDADFGVSIVTSGSSRFNNILYYNPFEYRQILGDGGIANASANTQTGGKDPLTNLGGGNGRYASGVSATGYSADSEGCGGGATYVNGHYKSYTAVSGAGADGSVKIYVMGE